MNDAPGSRSFLHRLLIIAFVILVPAFAVSGCGKNTARSITIDFSKNVPYREIPGVTAEEINAIEEIRTSRGSFLYAMNHSTECFPLSDGSTGGYSALFCKWLSGLFGIPFKLEIIEWDDLISGLASNKIDFSGELTATDERQKLYFMTSAIAERPIKIMYISDREPLSAMRKLRNVVYAFLDGTTAHDLVAPYLGGDYQALVFGDYFSVYQALKDGRADAFFEDGPAAEAFVSYGDVIAEDFFPLIYEPVSMTTQNPELSPIISVVQKALNSGAAYHLTMMYNEGYNNYLKQKLAMQLTSEEIEYIQMHNTPETAIIAAAEYDNYPATFFNPHDKGWQGVSFDVLREIERYTGLRFSIKHKPYTEWPDILRMLEEGQVSVVTELLHTQGREGRYIWTDMLISRIITLCFQLRSTGTLMSTKFYIRG
jgi:ABC-type amino acid transport substrate-binding protein